MHKKTRELPFRRTTRVAGVGDVVKRAFVQEADAGDVVGKATILMINRRRCRECGLVVESKKDGTSDYREEDRNRLAVEERAGDYSERGRSLFSGGRV